MFRTISELFLPFRPFKRQQASDKLRFLHKSYMRANQNGGLLLREKQARQLSTCLSKPLTVTMTAVTMTMEPWNHGTIEPLNEKSQIAQEYGLLPAGARQQWPPQLTFPFVQSMTKTGKHGTVHGNFPLVSTSITVSTCELVACLGADPWGPRVPVEVTAPMVTGKIPFCNGKKNTSLICLCKVTVSSSLIR